MVKTPGGGDILQHLRLQVRRFRLRPGPSIGCEGLPNASDGCQAGERISQVTDANLAREVYNCFTRLAT
jgi:hypothetical protein